MANMSYCRFENTLGDMRDCLNAMREAENLTEMDLNSYERDAFERMRQLAADLQDEIDRLQEAGEVDEYDESMDGDHDSAMASAGFGVEEDYGYSGHCSEDEW